MLGNQRQSLSFYDLDQAVETKEPNQFPNYVTSQMKLLSLVNDPNSVIPYGSYNNRIAQYPGDIDLLEIIEDCCNTDEIADRTAKRLQAVVKKIDASEDYFLSEIKAGIDVAFLLDNGVAENVGELSNGVYTPYPGLRQNVELLHNLKIINKKAYDEITGILKKPVLDGNDYNDIYGFFRDRLILRWNKKEILDGYKMIRGEKYPLKEAVKDYAPIKIDSLVIDPSGKVLEVTNFVIVKDQKGNVLNQDPEDVSYDSLEKEIEKLYFSEEHYQPFKMAKRAYALLKKKYGKTKKNKKVNILLSKYVRILDSTIGILYAIFSEIDAITLILQRGEISKDVVDRLNFRIDQLKTPLANVLEISVGELNKFIRDMNKIIDLKDLNAKAKSLRKLQKSFGKIIDEYTIKYMQKLGINPPPDIILPKNRMYADSVRGGFITDAFKHIYKATANAYRSSNCDGKSRQLELGEFHLGCHNFTGPGTRIDLESVRNHQPYNEIDACSKQHDLDYLEALDPKYSDDQRKELIRIADINVIRCYDKHPNVSGHDIAKSGINNKMRVEKAIPPLSRLIFGEISGA